MSIDTVLFDLDETLIEYRSTTRELLGLVYEELDIEPIFSAETYKSRFEEFLDESVNVIELRERCFGTIAEERGHSPAIGREMAAVYTRLRDHTDVRFRDGATAALNGLAPDYTLGVVTNGPPTGQREKIRAVGLDEWIESVVFAGFDTPAKPDPAPFERALGTLGSTPEGAVVVGNSLRSDIAGARAAGITSVWVPADEAESDKIEPEYRIDSLHELVPPIWTE